MDETTLETLKQIKQLAIGDPSYVQAIAIEQLADKAIRNIGNRCIHGLLNAHDECEACCRLERALRNVEAPQ